MTPSLPYFFLVELLLHELVISKINWAAQKKENIANFKAASRQEVVELQTDLQGSGKRKQRRSQSVERGREEVKVLGALYLGML